jgi:hypothetical protein
MPSKSYLIILTYVLIITPSSSLAMGFLKVLGYGSGLMTPEPSKSQQAIITTSINPPGRPEVQQALSNLPPAQAGSPIYVNVNVQDNTHRQEITFFGFELFKAQPYQDLFNTGKKQALTYFNTFTEWVSNHKKTVACYGIVATYGSAQAYISYLSHKLSNPTCWSLLHADKQLEQLYQVPQADFAHNLVITIQSKYTTARNPIDLESPLITFMRETEQEKKHLSHYKKIIGLLKFVRLDRLFFYDSKLFDAIQRRMDHLAYMKATFIAWLSDYKLRQPHRS